MRKICMLIMALPPAMLLILAGCSKESSITQAGPPTDEQALKQQITGVDSIAMFSSSDEATIDDNGLQDDEFDAETGMSANYLSRAGVSADSIYPVRWGRHIDWKHISYDYSVTKQGDSVATATIKKSIPGEFWVGLGTRSNDTTHIDTVVKKRFIENASRIIRFKRIGRSENPFRNWVPVAMTMVEGKIDSVNKFAVDSVEISANIPQFDETITNPLATWFRLGLWPLRGSIPIFPAGDSVRVRLAITSSDSTAEIAYLRHGIAGDRPDRRRLEMNLISATGNQGQYTRIYERKFKASLPRLMGLPVGRFNIVVDVLSRGSIYDNASPFANEFWGMPYMVWRPF